MTRATWTVGAVVLVGGAAVLALAAPRARGLWARLQQLPQDFRAAYTQREAELRGALLPDEETVAAARAHRRDAAAHDGAEDDLPYEFF